MTRKFDKRYLVDELELPWNAIEDTIIDTGRWTITHKILFQDKDGKYY